MPPASHIEFIRNFFFTDIMNHLEFLKWTGTLEKDDDVLLIYILERLASAEPPLAMEPFYFPGFPSSSTPSAYGSIHHGISSPASVRTSSTSIAPQQSSLPKNPLHIAKAYAQIQKLGGHEYNIFEFAYLDPSSFGLRAAVAFGIQVGFFTCLVIYNVFENRIVVTPDEDGFGLVVIILVMSSILFFSEIRRQRRDAKDFNAVMQELVVVQGVVDVDTTPTAIATITNSTRSSDSTKTSTNDNDNASSKITFATIKEKSIKLSKQFLLTAKEVGLKSLLKAKEAALAFRRQFRPKNAWLFLNYLINNILGVLVFFFNIYFILVSDDPTEAVLNSVALAFIIEIDDVFKPNWNEENTEDALAELMLGYITQEYPNQIQQSSEDAEDPAKNEDGTQKGPVDLEDTYVKVEVTGQTSAFNHHDGSSNNKTLYVQLKDLDDTINYFQVSVFVAAADNIANDVENNNNSTKDDCEKDHRVGVTTRYHRINYHVSGARAPELHEAFEEFHCLENFQDILKVATPLYLEQQQQQEHNENTELEPFLPNGKHSASSSPMMEEKKSAEF